MKFSEWIKSRQNELDKAGEGYDNLSELSKQCIDYAVDRYIAQVKCEPTMSYEELMTVIQKCAKNDIAEMIIIDAVDKHIGLLISILQRKFMTIKQEE